MSALNRLTKSNSVWFQMTKTTQPDKAKSVYLQTPITQGLYAPESQQPRGLEQSVYDRAQLVVC